MVIQDGLLHGREAAGHERRDADPDRLQDGACRLKALREQQGRHHYGCERDHDGSHLCDELRGLDDVGHDVLAARFGRIELAACALAEHAKRERDDDETEPSEQMHHEAEGVVSIGQMIEVEDQRCAGRGDTGYAVEHSIEEGDVVTRQIERDGAEQTDHDPCEANDRQCLLTVEPPWLDAAEPERGAAHQGDADGEEVSADRIPFLEDEPDHERSCHERSRPHDEDTKVVADDAKIIECESLPHTDAARSRGHADQSGDHAYGEGDGPEEDDERQDGQHHQRHAGER